MSFKELNLKNEYRSFEDNMIGDFYIPLLNQSIRYDRAVGFFSSTALIEITRGLSGLIKNNGKIRLIASPKLSNEDIEAIAYGYKTKKEIISTNILNSFEKDFNVFEKKRLNLLAHLISKGLLDIKIALIENNKGIGIFHDKLGIVEDKESNFIAFSGSLNETANAFSHNYEAIDIFRSWTYDKERVDSKVSTFENIWSNTAKNIVTVDFPEVGYEKLQLYKMEEVELDLDEAEAYFLNREIEKLTKLEGPILPESIKIRDYQIKAIESWEINEFRGIFNMATGTGKTITGLAAAAHLAKTLNHKLALVIVCPYQHLVNQWVEDIELFNMKPIIGHSASRQRKWKERFKTAIESYNLEVSDHFCFVTTNATFSSDYVQQHLRTIQRDLLLIVDEAHNFGAGHLNSKLPENPNYRLALSATIHRHNDEEGTDALFNYFGSVCIEYTLEMAIRNDMLTPYYYYPIPVFLNEEELQEYRELTARIGSMVRKDRFGKVSFSDSAKMLLLKRAKIIAGSSEKIEALEKAIMDYKDKSHLLVYCGATTISDPTYEEGKTDVEEKRQIDVVVNLMGNKLDMKISKFTSEEPASEREVLKQSFDKGDQLQALVAIRCLDEGVNIPSIKTAFILASSTNPKEYIQRRGRVLRKFKGKQYAEIYDFITLPVPFTQLNNLTEDEILSLKSLPLREIERMKDFSSVAENSSVADDLISTIQDYYLLNREGGYSNEFDTF
ncbi:DEAD/DEAH box helicase family protein [Fictibacillus sp. KIGAM418]|uniref:DEAD/DEAH box helicase family protein n=1 Tax=Fictibacillus marinisediminis TaxID=2878389 RepID=A0A9X1X965_9BACL|nr:DEAD/DEAH box helicase family protein [Fictibacillus marinisediminis]MCK6255455.1 DEAD/DEAH box helicase family protein [Fictibacillus marinisediminis]